MALTGLEAAALAAQDRRRRDQITLELVADAVQRKAVVYDRQGDAHYDVVSAFIKSIRGSDPDAALFWLARMIEAGEDPRFIARRLIVHASEDVGLADPMALLQATAAAHAVEHVGLPEARLNLAQATIYLARAPKSNSVITALGAAPRTRSSADPVPAHLRDASYGGARSSGHGKGYRYPHDFPDHHVDQPYRPDPLRGSAVLRRRRAWARRPRPWTPGAGPVPRGRRPRGRLTRPRRSRRSGRHHGRMRPMTVVAVTGSETALLIMAAFWAVLVVVLCVVLIGTYNVLTSTKITIDAMREETVPLLREIKTSVEKTNREIDRVDTVLASAGSDRGPRGARSGLVEEAASGPLVKLISAGRRAAQGPLEGHRRKAEAVRRLFWLAFGVGLGRGDGDRDHALDATAGRRAAAARGDRAGGAGRAARPVASSWPSRSTRASARWPSARRSSAPTRDGPGAG